MPSEIAPLQTVVVKHARDAFRTLDRIAREWEILGFTAPPDFDLACAESDAFVALLEAAGAEVLRLEADDRVNLDSIYARDAAIVSSRGVIQCRMGKAARSAEPDSPARGVRQGGACPLLGDRTARASRGWRLPLACRPYCSRRPRLSHQ